MSLTVGNLVGTYESFEPAEPVELPEDEGEGRPPAEGYIGVPEVSTDHGGTVDTTMAGSEHESADAVTDSFGTGDGDPEPDPEPDPEVTSDVAPGADGTYDPDEHTVTEVKQYFLTASPEEIERVKEAERNGQNRSGIANYS